MPFSFILFQRGIMDSFFTAKTAVSKKTEDQLIRDPFLHRAEGSNVFILTASLIEHDHVFTLRRYARNLLKNPTFDFNLLYTLNCEPSDKDLKGNLEDLFSKISIDLKKYIPPNSIVLSLGRALFSVTKNTDILVDAFYDLRFNTGRLYDPHIDCFVHPCDDFYQIFNRQNSGYHYANYSWSHLAQQLVRAMQPLPVKNIPKPILVKVEDTEQFFKDHMHEKEVAWDIETSGGNYMTDYVRCITMSFDGVTGYFLRWKDINPESLNTFFKGKIQYGANLKFDLRFLRHRGITNATLHFDTLNAGHLLNEMRSNSLKTHAWIYSWYGGYDDELKKYKKKYPKMTYAEFPEGIIFPYATMDAIVTFQVMKAMEKELKADPHENGLPNLWDYYNRDVIPSILMYLEFELEGMYVNWDRVREVGELLKKDIADIENRIQTAMPGLDLSKGNGLGLYIENVLRWECLGRTKAGVYLTNKKVMLQWKRKGYKEASLFMELSEVQALYQTFVGDEIEGSGLWKYRYPDGRIHGTFWVMLAKSHRNRSSEPNLQNIPKNGKKAILIRSMFSTPDENYFIAETDGAGLQLRIGASQSGDPVMRKIFINEDGDMHSTTAFRTFVKADDTKISVTDDETGKTWEFFTHEEVTVLREDVKIVIEADELLETDLIVEEK